MSNKLSSRAKRVQEYLEQFGYPFEVTELPASTRTAKDAAEAIGCEVAHIAKSLIFRGGHSNAPLLVIASGINRVNVGKIAEMVNEPVEKADADYVREQTGFAIGGVPPVAHTRPMQTFIDEDLLQYDVIWAAAGTPHAVFKLKPQELLTITGGSVVSVK